jgi:hypothetical protein
MQPLDRLGGFRAYRVGDRERRDDALILDMVDDALSA